MRNKTISWNIDGFFAHFDQYQLVCQDHNPIYFHIQETKFKFNYQINKLGKYKCYTKNFKSQNNVAQGGIMTLIDENYNSTQIQLRTELQAIAIKVFYPIEHTICNLYSFLTQN